MPAINVALGSVGLTCPCNTPEGMNTHGLVKGWQASSLRVVTRKRESLFKDGLLTNPPTHYPDTGHLSENIRK